MLISSTIRVLSKKKKKKKFHFYLEQTSAAGFHHTTDTPTITSQRLNQSVTEGGGKAAQNQRTCRQNEGLRGSRRERGRGLVTVPAVWVKKVKHQIMRRVIC